LKIRKSFNVSFLSVFLIIQLSIFGFRTVKF
jgi:hypothetical protein